MHASEAYSAQAKRMGDLISEAHEGRVIVPAFQRGYSWGKKHVDAFWKDIEEHRKKRKTKGAPDKYFLGPIVIMPGTASQDLVLLDGQQRVATATILLSVLRDLAGGRAFIQKDAFGCPILAGCFLRGWGLSLSLFQFLISISLG
jgi:hypothetical protein